MSRDVYSLRIFATASLESASGLVGPLVPDGLVYVLRDIDVFEQSDTSGATLEVIAQTGGLLWVVTRTDVGNILVAQWRGRQVYNEGEQVGFKVLSGTWSIAASGYQLTLP